MIFVPSHPTLPGDETNIPESKSDSSQALDFKSTRFSSLALLPHLQSQGSEANLPHAHSSLPSKAHVTMSPMGDECQLEGGMHHGGKQARKHCERHQSWSPGRSHQRGREILHDTQPWMISQSPLPTPSHSHPSLVDEQQCDDVLESSHAQPRCHPGSGPIMLSSLCGRGLYPRLMAVWFNPSFELEEMPRVTQKPPDVR
ncbi:hypothetical protein B0J18DRAFT_114456 [Chaetomium sp. MPI-SDFR-AT-0129]|nr:hypothetical protein B0J18DRAFT_114456 [Chaetomium sp. MPI-SDFR-AT-0129]